MRNKFQSFAERFSEKQREKGKEEAFFSPDGNRPIIFRKLFLRYKGNCDTRKWPVKFRDFRETGPSPANRAHVNRLLELPFL